mmetsp:Transcript_25713/g.51856  ORF Transcript_25713/g.51856 Transcript_25713/m.51856 type:complete len:358 (+) Transcript_25713:113-1186(+)
MVDVTLRSLRCHRRVAVVRMLSNGTRAVSQGRERHSRAPVRVPQEDQALAVGSSWVCAGADLEPTSRRHVIAAPQRAAEERQDGRQEVAAKGGERQSHRLRWRQLPAGRLQRRCGPEDALAARHEEARRGRPRPRAGEARGRAGVGQQGRAPREDLAPVAVHGPREAEAGRDRQAPVAREQRRQEGVRLRLRGQAPPGGGQLQVAEVEGHLVRAQEPEVEGAAVARGALRAPRDLGGQRAGLRGGAGLRVVPVGPDRLLPDPAVHRGRRPPEAAERRQVPQPGGIGLPAPRGPTALGHRGRQEPPRAVRMRHSAAGDTSEVATGQDSRRQRPTDRGDKPNVSSASACGVSMHRGREV